MYLLPRFIPRYGLAEFVLDGIQAGIIIDLGAFSHILEKTKEIKKLCIRNTKDIETESLGKLISMISDLLRSVPPKLTELDFGGIGGSAEQGD